MSLELLVVFVILIPHTSQDCPPDNCLRCSGDVCILCAPGYYGSDCGHVCPSTCLDLCPYGVCKGCKAGWYGRQCQSRCPPACGQCEQAEGYCPQTVKPPAVCSDGCYCIYGHCTQCKPGYSGENCRIKDDDVNVDPSSSYSTLQAVLVGIGLLLGMIVLVSCVTFALCHKYKRLRAANVQPSSRSVRTVSTSNSSNVTSVELDEMGDNSVRHVPPVPYFIAYSSPPSYDSLFMGPEDKPPPYEEVGQL